MIPDTELKLKTAEESCELLGEEERVDEDRIVELELTVLAELSNAREEDGRLVLGLEGVALRNPGELKVSALLNDGPNATSGVDAAVDIIVEVELSANNEVIGGDDPGSKLRLVIDEDMFSVEKVRNIAEEERSDGTLVDDALDGYTKMPDVFNMGTVELEPLEMDVTSLDDAPLATEDGNDNEVFEGRGATGPVSIGLELPNIGLDELGFIPEVASEPLGLTEGVVEEEATDGMITPADELLEPVNKEDGDSMLPNVVGNPGPGTDDNDGIVTVPELGADVGDVRANVVVSLGVTLVPPVVNTVEILVTDEAPGPVDGFGRVIVNALLPVDASELRDGLEGLIDKDVLIALDVWLMVVYEMLLVVVGCPFGAVLVIVTRMLDVTGSTGFDNVVKDVCGGLNIMVERPRVVGVTTALEADGMPGPGVDPGGIPLSTVVGVTLIVIVGPPIVVVGMIGIVAVVGEAGYVGGTGGAPSLTVVEILANIVVDPPGMMLVTVINTLEIVI